jgi:hypothetical protein
MLRLSVLAGTVAATLLVAGLPARADVTGKWLFRHEGNKFQGAITLEQTGPDVRGTWHTEIGKSEPDTELVGRVERNILYLKRLFQGGSQTYVLAISPDGSRIDGIGFGWGFDGSHINLNMRKAGVTMAPIIDISGSWIFRHDADHFQGTIALKQSGAEVVGTWHTAAGGPEPDTEVSGQVEGDTLYLRRSLGDAEQRYVLTISADGNRIDGFGYLWLLNHTDLSLTRAPQKKPVR